MAIAAIFLTMRTFLLLWLLRRSKSSIPVALTHPKQALPDVTVLIPCFNEEKVLAATVHSVMRSRGVHIQRVVCIDDGSQDGTANVMHDLERHYGSIIQCLGQPNAGKAAALNHGLRHVYSVACACIDADTQLLPDTLASLARCFDEPGVAAVAGHLAVGDSLQAEGVLLHGQQVEYAVANTARRALSSLTTTLVVPGAVGLFSASTVRTLGGYSLQTLAEDHDLTMTLVLAGYKLRHAPWAWALTEVPASPRSLYRQRLRWATGKYQVWIKHRSVLFAGTPRRVGPWLFMLFHELLAPLTCLPLLLGLSLLAFVDACQAEITLGSGLGAITVLANVIVGYVSHRSAWHMECEQRATVGLKVRPSRFWTSILINLTGFATAWHGLFRVTGKRDAGWRTSHRRADVSLPAQINTSQHPADISDTKQ